ncbi:MAG: GNAT family N-acetyltransferase [Cyanobacteriota bacterium]|nr:GNAT family N-acetyltransferase [Cyanobacteriota bacterium]
MLQIEILSYDSEFSQIQAIRREVFQEEQGVDPQLEFDGLDAIATHFLAYWHGQVVGTARIRDLDDNTAKIERLAVLKSARNQGIGSQLMQKALDFAAERNRTKVIINAQEYVKKLYQKLGFEQVGEVFEEAGIPHVKMIKRLSL